MERFESYKTNLEFDWAAAEILPVESVALTAAAGTVDLASTVDVATVIVVERFSDLSQTFAMYHSDLPNDCQVLRHRRQNEVKTLQNDYKKKY